MKERPQIADIEDYFGVPVLVQLKFPLASVMVNGKARGRLPYAADPEKSYWVPMPNMEGGGPSATQLMMFAVLREAAPSVPTHGHSVVEMRWTSVSSDPLLPGEVAATGKTEYVAVLATLLDVKDIVAITRVVEVTERQPSLILKA